ncbi:MAG: PEGA domain-containing protein, partial [Candidatus Bathyarchaeia archaeon]
MAKGIIADLRYPKSANVGDTVTVEAIIRNDGFAEGSIVVQFGVQSGKYAAISDKIDISPLSTGSSKTVSWSFTVNKDFSDKATLLVRVYSDLRGEDGYYARNYLTDGRDVLINIYGAVAPPAPPEVPAKGKLLINSVPSGAFIYINGVKYSKAGLFYTTPSTIELDPGTYYVRVELSGYKVPSDKVVTISANEYKEIMFLLEPITQPTP